MTRKVSIPPIYPIFCYIILFYCIVAEAVVSKRGHQLNGNALEVSPLLPQPPPPLREGPFEANLLLLYGAPASADSDRIKEFIQQSAAAQVQKVAFGIEPGKAMISFNRKPSKIILTMHALFTQNREIKVIDSMHQCVYFSDYSALRALCMDFPLMDEMVQVQKILESKSIQVFGYSGSLQFLELYFENTRQSGGGPLEDAVEQDNCFIVTFAERKCKPATV
jgi:hypothetical protein